ncbi:MAG TPA: sulfatase-like hydrolase/transferase, partial [Bacteroidia bacterium]
YKTLKEQLTVIYDVFNVKGPKYVFLHIVSPHPPYMCDENGNFKSSPRVSNVWWEPKKDYLIQLKFINKETIKFINEIFKQSKKEPVIIVQSDHGPFIQSKNFKEIYDARSMILNSYYIPYSGKEKLYPTITPVNSFRLVFNGIFKDSLPLLKDIPLDSNIMKKNMNSNLLLNNDI